MKLIIVTLFILITIISCNKPDSLKSTPEVFVGEWEWEYSVVYRNYYDFYGQVVSSEFVDVFYPNSPDWNANFSATIKVKKNGSVMLFEDGEKMATIKGKYISYSQSNQYLTSYKTPSRSLKSMNGVYSTISMYHYKNSPDTIQVIGYPYYANAGPYSNEIAHQNGNTHGVDSSHYVNNNIRGVYRIDMYSIFSRK